MLKRTCHEPSHFAEKLLMREPGSHVSQELFRTPYFPQEEYCDATLYAEPVPGETTTRFAEFARYFKVTVIVPFFEKGWEGITTQPW